MLTRKKQVSYLAKKDSEWQDHLDDFGRTRGQEALHDLRVAIKKIKAFARLSEACSGRAAVKDFRLLKKMFRQAGALRDVGNRLQRLEHFHVAAGGYKQEQQQLQEKETAVFIDHIGQYRKKGREAGRRLLADLHSIRAGCIRNWYAQQLIRTGVLLTTSGDRLHKARRQIKELLYVHGLLPLRLAKELDLDKEYLDGLQEAIGKWHDAAMVATSWAGKDLDGSQAMIRECRDKEAAVRRMAENFHLRTHQH